MSVWSKAPETLTFADLDAFLAAQLSESARLDYKLSWPSNLEKAIAAFANTIGGLVSPWVPWTGT